MKKLLLFTMIGGSVLLASQNLKEIEEQNKVLEAQIKQKELKLRLESLQEKENRGGELEQKDKNSGYLFGLGLGFAHQNLRVLKGGYLQLDKNSSSYDSFALGLQIGKFKKWNDYVGLMYYYNLDLIVDKNLNFSDQFVDMSGVISASTFNTDMMIDVIDNENYSFGFLVGVGLGFDITHYYQKSKSTQTDSGSATLVDFDVRANVGVRATFKRNYQLSLNCSMPFLSNSITANPVISSTSIEKSDVIFNIRFAYLLF